MWNTNERTGKVVDVGPLVIAYAQAAELVQPRKRPFDDPPPLAEYSHRGSTPWNSKTFWNWPP
jgi:hypothetical protein